MKQWKKFRFSSDIHSTNLPPQEFSLSDVFWSAEIKAKPPFAHRMPLLSPLTGRQKTSQSIAKAVGEATALPYSQNGRSYLCGCTCAGSLVVHAYPGGRSAHTTI